MAIQDTLAALRADAEFMRDVTAWERAPEQPARLAAWPARLRPAIVDGLRRRGVDAPWTHQASAIEAALDGQHVAVTASAAGGKTLCFQAPILQALLNDPAARALLLFPTKALTQDQLNSLSARLADCGLAGASAAAYDGDTPQGQRAEIRRNGRVIVTNADMLHLGILPQHTKWAGFLRNLRIVVIDEMHAYRGVFGSHVANVIRRLRRLCAFYGSAPQFILASATLANAREHAERLIEAPVTLIDDDGSPRGERHVIIVNPPLVDALNGIRRSAQFVARDIGARLVKDGLQTICFARSRQDTEVLLSYLRDAVSTGAGRASVAGYRGGYLADERRQIEAGLRQGDLRAVVATNALELGIDIGELDACVMLGYPGSIASFWQQAGRAGRRRNASLAVMVSSAIAIDQYLAAHPEYLFRQSPEHARIAPDNLGILAPHVTCAAFELPFLRGERFGRAYVDELLDALVDEGELHASPAGFGPRLGLAPQGGAQRPQLLPADGDTRYTWIGDGYPAERVGLRGAGDRVLIAEEISGATLGETERATAAIRVHPGAIYLHQGERYIITQLDWEKGEARALPAAVDYYTQPSSRIEVSVLKEFTPPARDRTAPPPGEGEIEITSKVVRFRQVQFNTHQTLGWGDVDLPEQRLITVGYWFSVPEALAQALARRGLLKLPNDYGPNWRAQRDAARARDGFACLRCGKAEPPDRQHDVHHVRPFRQFGYFAGDNDHYLKANALENLMTVCPDCHRLIETAEAERTGLEALGYLMGNLAPLFVMCDAADLSVVTDSDSPHTHLPTVTVYEMTPGGVGFSDELIQRHAELLRMALQRINECDCQRGCPACVGPIEDGSDRDLKAETRTLIEALIDDNR